MSVFKHKVNSNIAENSTSILFDNYFDYTDYINDLVPKLRGNSKSIYDNYFDTKALRKFSRDENWFGTTSIDFTQNEINTFLFSDRLNTELSAFDRSRINIEQVNLDQKPKITFTSQEIGIFSFDLASLGLIPVVEYYSPLLDKIVSGDFIRSYKTPKGQVIFYHIFVAKVPKHILEQKNGKLYSPILKIYLSPNDENVVRQTIYESIQFFYLETEEIPKHDVVQRQVIGDNGLKKFTSTWKKSFIYIPKLPFNLPQLDIIIQVSYSASKSAEEDLFWTSVLANAIIEKLSKSNLKFRVYGGTIFSWSGSLYNDVIANFIKLKDINDPVNLNTTAIISSDARNYRYQNFKFIATSSYDNGYDSLANNGYGYPINDRETTKNFFINTLEAKKDFGSSMEDSLNPDTKIIINAVNNLDQVKEQYDLIIQQITRLTQ